MATAFNRNRSVAETKPLITYRYRTQRYGTIEDHIGIAVAYEESARPLLIVGRPNDGDAQMVIRANPPYNVIDVFELPDAPWDGVTGYESKLSLWLYESKRLDPGAWGAYIQGADGVSYSATRIAEALRVARALLNDGKVLVGYKLQDSIPADMR